MFLFVRDEAFGLTALGVRLVYEVDDLSQFGNMCAFVWFLEI